jgi:hypothetical protein
VPLTAANQLLLLNQPFRSGIREQTVARAARLGQDLPVDVWDVLLDTGDLPNISTRSNDIMEWSQQQVASIIGVTNVDLDSLALEAREGELDGHDFITELALEAADVTLSLESASPAPANVSTLTTATPDRLPAFLYHGSMYQQSELMPGFKRSGTLVKWDGCEDNTWLYSTSDREEAILLGISSAIEKNAGLKRYAHTAGSQVINLEFYENPMSMEQIYRLPIYLYTVAGDKHDGWMPNYNASNGMVSEYKTQQTVSGGVARCEAIDVRSFLHGWRINIK